MGKKKVLFLITKSNWGGAQRYVYDLAVGLPKDRYEVVIALGGDGVLAQELRKANIRVIDIPSLVRDISFKKEVAALREIFRLVKKERPDVFHVNSSKAGGLGVVVGRLLCVPRIIYTAHGGWMYYRLYRQPLRALAFFTSFFTVLLSHTTICVSEHERMILANWPFMKKRLRVVYNGLRPTTGLARVEARVALTHYAKTGLAEKDILILTVAELHPRKNLAVAIRAAAKLGVHYWIIGEGISRPELEKLIDELDSVHTVRLLGRVPEAERYLAAADIFFLPSLAEGLPYALLEAAAAGLPTVASCVDGIPEVITEDGTNGYLVNPNDVEGFSQALRKLVDDPKRRLKMGNTLKETSRDFSLENLIRNTTSLYE